MDIANRMKSYESDERLPKGAVIVRVDGRAFHTWVKRVKAVRPFDQHISSCMRWATYKVSEQMQGFKLAYTQSDESTFLISNLGEKEGAWFDYKAQKIASVTASLFTEAFNAEFSMYASVSLRPFVPAHFDARAFSIPVHDAANNFVWRQQDWYRNSVQMLGHHHMSHAKMQGLKAVEVRSILLEDLGIDWAKLDDWQKYGAFIVPTEGPPLTTCVPLSYDEINQITGFDQYLELINDPN
jgi:tRNA(His) 5'-end guanylyltransferase